MGTRRPRVPRSASGHVPDPAQTSEAPGADAEGPPSHGSHPVSGHSANVIPFDAAPSRHAVPSPEQRRAAERRALVDRSSVRADTAPTVFSAAPRLGADRSDPVRPVEPVPARTLSGRSLALLVVAIIGAVLVAPTLRVYLNQQAEISSVQQDIADQQRLRAELTAQISRWDDPAYVQQQARDRLNLVMPGEKKYMVVGGDTSPEEPTPEHSRPDEVNPEMPWADGLWDSVVRAGTN